MYTRQGNGFPPSALRVPRNYSGSAFREEPLSPAAEGEAAPLTVVPEPSDPPENNEEPTSAVGAFSTPGFRLDFGRLFRREGGGLDTETLLLLGLILLLSQSDAKDDLLLFLVLLLFIQ